MVAQLGLGLLANYNPNDWNAALDGGLNGLILQEHVDQLKKVIDKSDFPALRSFHKKGVWSPTENPRPEGWMAHGDKHMDFSGHAQYAIGKGKLLYILGYNEPTRAFVQYGSFEAQRAILLHDIGARAIIGNFGVGVPTPENMTQFFTAFYQTLKDRGRTDIKFAIGFHEYGYVWPWAWQAEFQGSDIDPFDRDTVTEEDRVFPTIPEPGDLGWLIGRFQIYYQVVPEVLAALGFDIEFISGTVDEQEIVMTEVGLDLIKSDIWDLPVRAFKDGTTEPFGGWRTCGGYWHKFFPKISWQEMYGLILQYIHAYYAQFKQVKVIWAFGLGPHHANDVWIDGRFIDYDHGNAGGNTRVIPMMIASKPPGTAPTLPPSPPEPPTTLPPTGPLPPHPHDILVTPEQMADLQIMFENMAASITDAHSGLSVVQNRLQAARDFLNGLTGGD